MNSDRFFFRRFFKKQAPKAPVRKRLLETLEDRVLYDAAPVVTVQTDTSVGLGETLDVTVSFDNAGTNSGFGPWVDVAIDRNGADGTTPNPATPSTPGPVDGFTLVNPPKYLGVSLNYTLLTLDDTANGGLGVEHPYATDANGKPVYVSTSDPSSPFYAMLNGRYQNGDLLMVIEMPFGSFTPDQPVADITFSLKLSELADVGTALPISASSGFRYGMDALNNPNVDPSIIGAPYHVSPQVDATLATISKDFSGPEGETATGLNYLRTYRISVDIAAGQTLTNLNLFDQLSDQLQFVGISGSSQAYTVITQPSATTPGGNIQVQFNGAVTGTASAQDAWIEVQFYVPRLDANGVQVLNADTGVFRTIENQAYGYANWTPADPRDANVRIGLNVTLDGSGNPDLGTLGTVENTFTAKSIAVQKGVVIATDTGAAGATPGDILTYTINFQVSDYYAFGTVTIEDVFSDGQELFLANFAPTLQVNGNTYSLAAAAITNYTTAYDSATGRTTITFDISSELIARGQSGNLIGGGINPNAPTPTIANGLAGYNDGATTGTITFQTRILDQFAVAHTLAGQSGEASLNSRDALANDVTIRANVLTLAPGFAANGNVRSDVSGANISIVEGVVSKTIHAINGLLVTDPSFNALYRNTAGAIIISPADTVTYRLAYTVPSGDLEDFRFADYLPLPVFNASELTTFNASGTGVPPPGSVYYGSGHTMNQITGGTNLPDPTIVVDAGNNAFELRFGDASDPTNTPRVVEILFTVTVGANAFADGLFLTNQALAAERSTQQPSIEATSQAIIQVVLGQPKVDIYKGVVASTKGGAVSATGGLAFASTGGNGFTGTLVGETNAAAIGALDLTASATLPDAGDLVRFAIVVQNTGGADAFDVTFKDKIADSYVNNYADATAFASATNLKVYDGAGTLLAPGSDYTLAWNNATKEFTVQLVDGGTGDGGLNYGRDPHNDSAVTNGGNSVVVLYDLTVATGALASSTITTAATLTNYAGAEGATDHTTLDQSDAAAVRIAIPSITKTLTGTSVVETGNGATQAVIGELVTYTLTLTVTEGTATNVVIRDIMDAGLAFVGVTSVSTSAGVTVGNPITTGTTPSNVTIGNSGGTANELTFNFGTITNTNTNDSAAETITITYQAVVLNVAGNQAGTQLNNSAGLTYVWTDDRAAAVVAAATTANLAGFSTANRGTITGVPTSIDGVGLVVGQLILVKDQTTAAQNGIYLVTAVGATATLVRADAYDQPAELRGDTHAAVAIVTAGTVNAGARYALTTDVDTVNSSAVTFAALTAITNTPIPVSAANVTVVEPQLTISNSLSTNNSTWTDNGTVQVSAGQTVYYQVVISNTGAVGAYDLSLYDRLPNVLAAAGVSGTQIFSVIVSDLDGSNAQNITANGDFSIINDTTYQFNPSFVELPALTSANSSLDLAAGKKITIVVQSRVKDDAVSASTHPNGIQVRWTSLNDNRRSQDGTDTDVDPSNPVGGTYAPIVGSIHNTASVERTGAEGPAGALNNYAATDDLTNTILQIQPVAIVKDLIGSQINNSTNSNTQAVVGEYVDYTISFDIPKGLTRGFTLTDVLPTGMAFVDFLSITVGTNVTTNISGVSGGVPTATANSLTAGAGTNDARLDGNTTVTTNGAGFTVNFGDIYNSETAAVPGDYVAPQQITITYRVVVTNIAANQTGATFNNVATIAYASVNDTTGTAVSVNTNSAPPDTVTLIEPALTIVTEVAKDSGGSPGAGTTPGAFGTSASTPLDAGDYVYYRIRITNPAAGSTTAYDLQLVDAVPSFINPASLTVHSVALTNAAGGVGGAIAVTDGGANTLDTSDFAFTGNTLGVAAGSNLDLGADSTLEIVIRGTVSSTIAPAATATNNATVRWSSVDGAAITSTYTTDDTERTGDGLTPAVNTNASQPAASTTGTLNNYAATSANATVTAATVSLTKTIVATSEAHTTVVAGVERVAIGEIVRYRLVTTIPEGASVGMIIRDNLPTGLLFVNDGTATIALVADTASNISSSVFGTSASVAGNAGTLSSITPAYVLGDTEVSAAVASDNDDWNSGTDPLFKLGDITNAENDANAEYIVIEFNALVLNTANTGNQAGTTLTNNYEVFLNNSTAAGDKRGSTSGNVDVVIAEPNLAVFQSVSNLGPVDAGDSFVYTIIVNNNSTGNNSAAAFDIRIRDILDGITASNPGVEIELAVAPSGTGGGFSGGSVALSKPGYANISANGSDTTQVDLTIDRLNAGDSVTLTVVVTVKSGALAGSEIENKAVVTYTSLPGATGTGGSGSTIASALAGSTVTGGALATLTANASERTGADSEATATNNNAPADNTVRNNYAVAASAASGIVVGSPTIDISWKDGSVSADDSSVTSTTGANAVIGESVVFDVLVTLPEGVTDDLFVDVVLPAGLRLDSYGVITTAAGSARLAANFNGTVNATPTVTGTSTGPGNVVFNFGDTTVVGDNVANNNSFVLRVTATVVNILANQAGVTRATSAQLRFNDPDGAANAGPAAERTIADASTANDPVVTIVEPTLTINKTSSTPPGTLDAGDTITYTITLTNTSGQAAYDVTLSDLIDTNLTTATLFSVSAGGGATAMLGDFQIVETSSGSGVYRLQTTSGANVDIPNGGTVTVVFTAIVSSTIPPAVNIANVANVRWTSTDGANADERGGSDVADNAPTTITQAQTTGALNNYALSSSVVNNAVNDIVVTKAVTNTSLGGNDGVAAPGEIVTYTLTVTLPEGQVPDLRILDALPAGMAYVSGSLTLDTTGFAGSVSAPAVTPQTGTTYIDGMDVVFDFAAITVTADNVTTNNTFTFTFQAIVLDVVSNDGVLPGQTTLTATATHNNGSGTTFATPAGSGTVAVVEPDLSITNTLNITGAKDAGAPFTYTIVVRPTANATSGAYEVSIADLLPAEFGSLSIASAIIGDGATSTNVAGNFSLTGNQLSTTAPVNLLLNTNGSSDQVLTIVVSGTLTSSVNPGETVNTTTTLAYGSLPGNQTAAGGYNPNADVTTDRERSYAGSDTESFTAPTATFSKTLFSTDQAFTSGTNVAIGELVTYALLVTLPEGTTPDLSILDRLPAGLQYVSSTVVTTSVASGGLLAADFNGTVPVPSVSGGSSSGADVQFNFGSIAVTGDNVTNNNSFIVLVTARVENVAGNQGDHDGAGAAVATVLGADAQFDISGDGVTVFTTPAVNVTVVEPRVNADLSVLSATTGIDAGDTVTYQVVLNNLSANGATADAFDVALSNVLPSHLLITGIGAPTLTGGASVDTSLSGTGGGTLTGAFDIPLGGTVTFIFTAHVQNSVTPGLSLNSDLNVTFSSLNGANANERTGAGVSDPENNASPANSAILNNYAVGADVDLTAAAPFSVAKSLANTSLGNDTSLNVVVGEVLTYQLAVSVMEGTTNSIQLVDTLPRLAGVNQLTYVSGSFTITNANGMTIASPVVNYNSATNVLTIDISSVVNPANVDNSGTADTDTFTLTYQARVANVAQNQSGTNLTNDVDATATGVAADNNNAITVNVREPVLGLTKTTTTPGVDAGDNVVYTLSISNTGNATAYDIRIQDALDAALALVTPGTALAITGGTGSGYATLTQTGNTSTSVDTLVSSLNAGDTLTITITARVVSTAIAGDTIGNTATLTYTSLPGTQTGERTGAGGVDDYTTSATSADFTLAVPTIDKLTPADTTYSIGETVTYDILITLPEGTTRDLVIRDLLPAGLVYIGYTVVPGTFAGTIGTPTVTNPSGNTREFSFGDVVTTADNNTGTNTFTLQVTARVANISGNQGVDSPGAATQFSNTAALQYTNGTTSATATVTDPTAPGAITVVEPVLSFTKTVISSTAGLDAGDTVTYRVVISNTGTATAHDVNFADTLPTGMLISGGVVNPTGGSSLDASTGGTGTNGLTYQFTIPVGGTVTITYFATLPDTVTPGATVGSTATVNWSSIDGADANERTGADGQQGGGTLNDYSLESSAPVTIATAFSVAKTLSATSASGSTGSNVLIGETLTYQLAVSVIEGTTNLLQLIDTLPRSAGQNQLVYVPGSAVVSNANGVTVNGFVASYDSSTNQLTLSATSVVNPGGSNGTTNAAATVETDTFFITYQVRVADVSSNTSGATLVNDVDATATGVSADNNNAVSVTVTEPALTLTKSNDDADGIVTRGQVVTYTLQLTNTGNATAYDVALTDLVPAGLTLVAGSLTTAGGANTSSGANINLGYASIAAGATVTVTYQARVDLAATPGAVIENNARVSFSSLPGTDTGERAYAPDVANEVYNATNDPRQDTDRITVGTATIGDRVWQDRNNDGVQNVGETGIGNVRVFVDLNNDGIFNSGDEPSATTDNNGNFTFTGLAAGTYDVRVDTSTLPASTTPSYDLDGTGTPSVASVTVTTGQTRNDVDFGYRGGASIGNLVWNDANGNGRQDVGEAGIAGVSVTLNYAGLDGVFGNADDQSFTTTTDASGLYAFTGLFGGNYYVSVAAPAGMVFTTQDSVVATDATDSDIDVATGRTGNFALGATATDNSIDAGLYTPVSLGNRVYYDLDGDGVQDSGEPGVSGVTVTIVWLGVDGVAGGGNDVTYTATTGANGAWSITGLPPGNYTATVSLATGGFNTLVDSIDNGALSATNGVTVSTTSGVNRTDIDFALRGSGSVGSRVYHDVNADGDYDTGVDHGLAGVTVNLTWFGQDGVSGGGDDVVFTTVTAADGGYGFANLPAGNFRIDIDDTTLPASIATLTSGGTGADISIGTDPTDFTLTAAQSNQALDFGYRGTGALAGNVFADLAGNGVKNTYDYGLGTVALTVVWAGLDGDFSTTADNSTFSLLTDSSGNYSLSNLAAGSYRVTVDTSTLPAGYTVPTYDLDGTGTPSVATTTLTTGQTRNDVDFGYRGTSVISDRVWLDLDGDGAQAANEPGVGGVTLDLIYDLDNDGVFTVGTDIVIATTTTDVTGQYAFNGLAPDRYLVRVTDTGGVLANATNTANVDDAHVTANGTDGISAIQIGAAVTRTDVDFGYRGASSLSGDIWNDMDGDGLLDTTEPGIAGVPVQLEQLINGVYVVINTSTTNSSGGYTFDGLIAGNYRVTVTTPPASSTPTYDLDGTGTPSVTERALGSNEQATDADFGYQGAASIGDLVYFDLDGDGVRDTTEPGLAGVTVFLDFNGNGVLDTNEARVTTAADGTYSFTGLVAGTYQVRVLASSLPTGSANTDTFDQTGGALAPSVATNPLHTEVLAAAETQAGVDFGFRGTTTISGSSYHDANKNNTRDTGETGLGGVTIELIWDTNNDGVVDAGDFVLGSTTTATDGTYSFGSLIAGNYIVRETQPTGFGDGENATNLIDVTLGATSATGQNFGNTTGSLSGRVFRDDNNDGLFTAGEAGLAGVSVTLEWSGVDGIFGNADDKSVTIATDASGNYVFDHTNTTGFLAGLGDTTGGLLSTGSYRIIETQPTGLLDGADNIGNASAAAGTVGGASGGRDGTDTLGGIRIGAGQDATGYTFADLAPISLGGSVFVDLDGDGVLDSFESGLQGVTVTLTGTNDLGQAVNIALVTGADGGYSFDNLRPSDSTGYTLTQTQPAGYNDGVETLGSGFAGGSGNGNGTVGNDIITGIVIVNAAPGNNAGTGYNFAESFPFALTKTLVSTSDTGTTGANVAIGETVRYRLTVTVPYGTLADFQLHDALPAGLLFLNNGTATVSYAGAGLSGTVAAGLLPDATISASSTANTDAYASDTDVYFKLGTLTNTDAASPASITIEFDARVVNEVGNVDGTVLTNTFGIRYDRTGDGASDADPTAVSNDTDLTVAEPSIAATKTVDDTTPHLGQTITYTITLTNNGTATAYDTAFTDTIPAGLAGLAITGVTLAGGATVQTTPVLATGGTGLSGAFDIPVGASVVITYTAQVSTDTAIIGGTFDGNDEVKTNTVTVTYSSLDGNPADARDGSGGVDSYTDTVDAPVTIVGADLAIVKDDGLAAVVAGQQWTYTLTITNNGTDTATGVVLADTIPPQVTINEIRVGGTPVAFTVVGGVITLNLPNVQVGAGNALVVEFDAELDAAIAVGRENITNTATVTHDDIEPTAADNTSSDTDLIDAAPALAVTKEVTAVNGGAVPVNGAGDPIINPGDTLIYTIVVTNTGTQHAVVNIVDTFPGVTLDLATAIIDSSETGVTAVVDLVAGTITWTGVGLDVGETITITIEATAFDPQLQALDTFNNGVVVTNVNPANPAEDGDTVSADELADLNAFPDLVVTKVNSTNRIGLDDVFTYTITLTNAGDQNATGVTIVDTLPPYVEFLGASGNYIYDPVARTVTWTSADNPELLVVDGRNAETITFTLTVRLPVNSIAFGTLTNNVRAFDDGTNGPDTNPLDNEAANTTEVLGFIYDVGHNFHTSTVFDRDGDDDDPYHVGKLSEVYKDALLPIAPIYSGAAEPGSTLEVVLYNANGDVIGRQSVVVDTGGNWMASFPGAIMKDYPQSVVITQTPPATQVQGGETGGYNMRPYYATAINAGHFFRENLNVTRISEQTAEASGEALQRAIENPIGFNVTGSAYESLAAPGHPTGR